MPRTTSTTTTTTTTTTTRAAASSGGIPHQSSMIRTPTATPRLHTAHYSHNYSSYASYVVHPSIPSSATHDFRARFVRIYSLVRQVSTFDETRNNNAHTPAQYEIEISGRRHMQTQIWLAAQIFFQRYIYYFASKKIYHSKSQLASQPPARQPHHLKSKC